MTSAIWELIFTVMTDLNTCISPKSNVQYIEKSKNLYLPLGVQLYLLDHMVRPISAMVLKYGDLKAAI